MTKITQVCVIGAGVMGSGIAAQVANSGTKVLLLDIVSKDSDRSSIARGAVVKMLAAKPPPLSHPKRAELIAIGNLDDDLGKIKDCQLIIEAIVEKLDVKHNLYVKLLPYLNPDTILASNTSTLPLRSLKNGLPDDVASRFVITHFFNPPRYMRLLELVTDKTTNNQITEDVNWFARHRLGKSIVESNDTPGFIANRIGCFLLELVLRKTIDHRLNVDTMDQMMIERMQLPSTGIFGLYDLIGLDVMKLIAQSLVGSLPNKDRFVEIYTNVPIVQKMIDEGYTGRKGRGGFYRLNTNDSQKIKEVIDLNTGAYRAIRYNTQGLEVTEYHEAIESIMKEFEGYVRSLVPEVTSNPTDIDRAMKLGYSWRYGPFELFDGAFSHEPRGQDTRYSQNIFDINTKMNVLSPDVFTRLIEAIESAKQTLYIYSDSPHFSAGADLKFLLQKIQDKDWKTIEDYLKLGQKAFMAAKYSTIPVISCARGVALGGGCELLLHSHKVIANQQLSAGLVEVRLGLIPAFGGTKEMVLRAAGDDVLLQKLLGNIIRQNKGTSADYFAEDYLVKLDVNMNEDYLLEEALATSQAPINQLYQPPAPSIGRSKIPSFVLDVDAADDNTKSIAKIMEDGLSGKDMNEADLLDFERESFMRLVKKPEVERRIKAIIST